MRRWTFNLAAMVSVVLSVATVVAWVRRPTIPFYARGQQWRFTVRDGRAVVDNEPQQWLEHEPERQLSAQIEAENQHSYSVLGRMNLHREVDPNSAGWLNEERRLKAEWRDSYRRKRELSARRASFRLRPLTPAAERSLSLARLSAGTAVIPLSWALAAALSIGHRLIRRQRHRCVRCGYSLTGNTSGVCPECGTPTKAVVKA